MFDIDVAKLADSVIKRIWPDATEVESAKINQLTQELLNAFNIQLQQIEVNKLEAQSTSFFVSGWRPASGWVCVLGFFYEFILRPIINGFGWHIWPSIETGDISYLLLGLLGMGGLRTFEKHKGIASM